MTPLNFIINSSSNILQQMKLIKKSDKSKDLTFDKLKRFLYENEKIITDLNSSAKILEHYNLSLITSMKISLN